MKKGRKNVVCTCKSGIELIALKAGITLESSNPMIIFETMNIDKVPKQYLAFPMLLRSMKFASQS